MANPTQPKTNPLPAILVYGTPTSLALTQASWFRAEDKEAVKAAAEALRFSVIELQGTVNLSELRAEGDFSER